MPVCAAARQKSVLVWRFLADIQTLIFQVQIEFGSCLHMMSMCKIALVFMVWKNQWGRVRARGEEQRGWS